MPRCIEGALAAGLALLGCALPALAGRPLTTEDAPVLDRGTCEAQLIGTRERAAGAPTAFASGPDLGCGVGLGTQVNLGLQRLHAGGERADGLALAGKTALAGHGSEDGMAWTVSYGLAAARTAGGGWSTQGQWVNAVVTRPLTNALALHANLGWQRDRTAHQDSTAWALALEHTGSAGLDATAELYGTDRDAGPWMQLGLRWSPAPEHWNLNASWARQAAGGHPTRLTLGALLRF